VSSRVTDPVTPWAGKVVAGKVLAGPLVQAAARRHLDDRAHAKARGLKWSPTRAARAIEFFSFLPHVEGEWAGRPFLLQPWQQFVVGSLFGWLRTDGRRRFREAYVEIPRKNGKSTLAAGLALLLAFFDDEQAAHVYCAATKKDQAKIVWGLARDMVQRTQALRRRIDVRVNGLSILAAGQKLEPLGKDADSMDGLNVHGGILDELHAHKSADVVDVVRTATVARRQPLLVYITTAGQERDTVCWAHHDYGQKVVEGILADDAWFVFIAAAERGADWTQEPTWACANPSFGVTVKAESLRQLCEAAQKVPSQQSAFRRLHLNEWLQADRRALDMRHWDGCADRALTLEAMAGKPCVAGLDLSTRIDMTALVLVFAEEGGALAVLPFFFIPEDNIAQRVQRDRVPVDVWVREGLVTATPGNITDYSFVYARLLELSERCPVQAVASDPWNAAALNSRLMADGFTVIEVRQGFRSLSEPTKQFQALVGAGKLRHPAHPCLTWNAGNLALLTDAAGNIMPDKARSTGRIDGVSAIVSALSRVLLGPEEGLTSSYADHRLVVV
jgi:phage terminase large subunit-like protein